MGSTPTPLQVLGEAVVRRGEAAASLPDQPTDPPPARPDSDSPPARVMVGLCSAVDELSGTSETRNSAELITKALLSITILQNSSVAC